MVVDPRTITISIAFSIVATIFFVLGALVLRKDPKYLGNRTLTSFFWLSGAAMIINLIYLFSQNTLFITGMNYASIICINFGSVGIFMSSLVIFKGENSIKQNKKILISLIILVLLIIIHLFIPSVQVAGDYNPYWEIPYGLYELFFSQIMVAFTYIFSFKFYGELSSEMKNKFKRYLIGLLFMDVTFLSITIDNMNIFPELSLIFQLLNFSMVAGAFFIYFGIVRKGG